MVVERGVENLQPRLEKYWVKRPPEMVVTSGGLQPRVEKWWS